MNHNFRVVAVIALIGCGSQFDAPRGDLRISKSTTLEFEATYTLPSGEWAHVHRIMGLYAAKMLLETSSGKLYKNDGLGLADTSRPTGTFHPEAGTPDEKLLEGMLDAFLAAGVNPSPDEHELGTPQYAAAYLVAEVLDINKVRRSLGDYRPMESEELPKILPYPGWNREDLVPEAARNAIGGEQNGSGICSSAPVSYCCGDFNCSWCDGPNYQGGCAMACAAGDHCNTFHGGSGCGDNIFGNACGTVAGGTACGTAADEWCPHTCGDRGVKDQHGLAQYQNNICGFSRLQWETSYCWYHTPEGHPYNYSCQGWNCGVLFKGQRLNRGGNLYSCDGRFRLTMQWDGNAVLYQGSTALWSSRTNGRGGCYITQQTDGNLVVYNCSNGALWASGTYGKNGAWLRVQEDGNLVIYLTDWLGYMRSQWASNTCCH